MNITSMETTGIKAGASFMNGLTFFEYLSAEAKVGCVFIMVIVSTLPHVEFGTNDHWEYTLHFI